MPCASGETIVKGDALADNGSGYLAEATSATAVDVHYVALETVTTASTGQLVLCIETEDVLFEADCSTAWTQASHVGMYADLASVATVDLGNTTNDLFYVLKGVGTSGTDTKVLGFFTRGILNT